MKAVAVLLLFLLSAGPKASAEETVKWGVFDWPPMHIVAGPEKGQGTFDKVMQHFQQRLPGYQHQVVVANTRRFWDYLKSGEHFCYVGSVQTPARERFAYFSLPDGLVLSNHVVMLKDRAAALGLAGPLSLATLLDNPQLKGGIISQRSYGKELDAVLRDHPKANLYAQSGGDLGLSLFRMLEAGRLDYIIEYPHVAAYFERLLGKEGSTLSLAASEAPPIQVVHVACPKTAWGQQMIARIDAIILADRGSEAYRRMLETWLTPDEQQVVRQAYDEVFIKE
ncbi:TIGR02285 family protein [Gallaecimonas kandeliae]|uniref:TIGR02285 family protein n=1 Tax=Gallaecimonas kandeliae TaxID=3029055 RepID=UPI00264761E7|nr:TIGR02285 family protein [Gallaecimonas kandeliae]WKE67431.1 TIGR02285 family protein [Gallaecimonas kandeliae]